MTCACVVRVAPELLVSLKNVRVEAGEKATLSCEMSSGRPAGEIHWYRSGRCCKIFREIFDDDKYEIKRDDKTMSLVISVTERTDSATYRCEAVNKFGKVRSECRLVVVQRTLPTFRTFRFKATSLIIDSCLLQHMLSVRLFLCELPIGSPL